MEELAKLVPCLPMSRIATLELSEEAVNAVTDHCGDNKRSLAIEEGLRGLQL